MTRFLLLVLSATFALVSVKAQDHIQLIGTFKNCSDVRLLDIPDEEPAWGGFRNDTEMFYIFNKDYTIRDSFPIDTPFNFGEVRKMQIVRYMTPDSSDLHLVVHFADWQGASVEMYSTEGQIFQYNYMNDFFWSKLHSGGSRLILYKQNGCVAYSQIGTAPMGTNGITQVKFISDEIGTRYFGKYNGQLVRLSSNLEIVEYIPGGGASGVGTIEEVSRFFYDQDEGIEIFVHSNLPYEEGKIINETGEVLFAFEGDFRFEAMNGVNDILVAGESLDYKRYRLPGFELCADGYGPSTRFQSGPNEEVLVEEIYTTMSEINLELFVPNENGYFEHYKTIFFPFEFEDVGAPYLRSVSNHFFNSDDEYEFVYTTLSNTSSELGVLLFIFNESGEVLWSNESLNINMHFGECLIDNYFTTSARMVIVLDDSQQYKVIEEFDCRNLPDDISGEVIVFPNPTNSDCRVALVDPNQFFKGIEILDLEGRLIESYQFQEFTSNDVLISTDSWSAGMFLMRIYAGNNVFVERVLKY